MSQHAVKEMVYDATCKTCLFYHLCEGIELPHCGGDDYVAQLGVTAASE